MTDFVGRTLEIGDDVVYSRILGSKLVMEKVEVLGFTNTKVKVTPLSCADVGKGYTLCNPDRLVMVGKVVAF